MKCLNLGDNPGQLEGYNSSLGTPASRWSAPSLRTSCRVLAVGLNTWEETGERVRQQGRL